MQPGILYKPVDPLFPAIDFVFVKEIQKDKQNKQVYCMQVTFSKDHKKHNQSISNYTIGYILLLNQNM